VKEVSVNPAYSEHSA